MLPPTPNINLIPLPPQFFGKVKQAKSIRATISLCTEIDRGILNKQPDHHVTAILRNIFIAITKRSILSLSPLVSLCLFLSLSLNHFITSDCHLDVTVQKDSESKVDCHRMNNKNLFLDNLTYLCPPPNGKAIGFIKGCLRA